jgi:hypothetical protein
MPETRTLQMPNLIETSGCKIGCHLPRCIRAPEVPSSESIQSVSGGWGPQTDLWISWTSSGRWRSGSNLEDTGSGVLSSKHGTQFPSGGSVIVDRWHVARKVSGSKYGEWEREISRWSCEQEHVLYHWSWSCFWNEGTSRKSESKEVIVRICLS